MLLSVIHISRNELSVVVDPPIQYIQVKNYATCPSHETRCVRRRIVKNVRLGVLDTGTHGGAVMVVTKVRIVPQRLEEQDHVSTV